MNPRTYPTWRKSRRSDADGNCVEIARAADGTTAVRDSKNPTGPILEFTPEVWAAFLQGVRDGDFDR